MAVYRFFAKTYGWHPDIVDGLSLPAMEWLPILEEAANDAQEIIQDQINQQNRRHY
jgi:hypothetical protein